MIDKIQHQADIFYRQHIVREQYPMLTSRSRRKQKSQGAIGVVYMLHHITKKDRHRIPTNEDLKVSPRFLEEIIIKYKKQGFEFISLDKLYERLTSSQEEERPFIVFTIDDGYLDNYTNALPVFERQNVPFAIFIATDFIDQKAILWWDTLEELVLQNHHITTGDGKTYPCDTFQEKWDTFRILREQILQFDQKSLRTALSQMFSEYGIDWSEPIRHQAMSWDQVRQISRHPLCTIGGHTVSHPALNKVSDDEFRQEVADGISKLASVTGHSIRHFAYPYGSPSEIGEREYRLIAEFGFKTVFSSYGGCVTESNKHHLTHLPRVYLHE